MDRMDHLTVDTRTALRERRMREEDNTLVATPAPTVGAGAMVMLMLGVLLLAMLAWWAVSQTGFTFSILNELFHTNAAQFCRANTC